MTNTNIKIPKQIYVGFDRYRDIDLPVASLVPYGTDSAAIKRQATVDRYSGNDLDPAIIDNIPLFGFRISRSMRRFGWKGTSTTIRIEDPRGFEYEITAVNMVMLTDSTTIQNGEILGACVWGRDGADNVLLPVNSSPYIEAAENTRRLGMKTSLRELTIGDTILTSKGITGVYMGSMYSIGQDTERGSRYISIADKKTRVIKIVSDTGCITYRGESNLKVAEIVSKSTQILTTHDSAVQIAKDCEMGVAQIEDSSNSWSTRCIGYSPETVVFTRIEFIDLNVDDLKSKLNSGADSKDYSVLIEAHGGVGAMLLPPGFLQPFIGNDNADFSAKVINLPELKQTGRISYQQIMSTCFAQVTSIRLVLAVLSSPDGSEYRVIL